MSNPTKVVYEKETTRFLVQGNNGVRVPWLVIAKRRSLEAARGVLRSRKREGTFVYYRIVLEIDTHRVTETTVTPDPMVSIEEQDPIDRAYDDEAIAESSRNDFDGREQQPLPGDD
jgi:hypothetical protein